MERQKAAPEFRSFVFVVSPLCVAERGNGYSSQDLFNGPNMQDGLASNLAWHVAGQQPWGVFVLTGSQQRVASLETPRHSVWKAGIRTKARAGVGVYLASKPSPPRRASG